MYEMEYFYEEQIRKLEQLDIEPLPFEDCICQVRCDVALLMLLWEWLVNDF